MGQGKGSSIMQKQRLCTVWMLTVKVKKALLQSFSMEHWNYCFNLNADTTSNNLSALFP